MALVRGDELTLWLRQYHPVPDSEVDLVCFPHAGGTATYYFPFSAALAPHIQVQAVQYPGRQDRRLEPGIDNIAELADALTEVLSQLERPFALFGHSMGAIVAFEVTRRLNDKGSNPLRLFASGRRAPSVCREETIHTRNDAGLIAELQALGGTDPRVLNDPELQAMFMPMTRNDYRAIETYRCAAGASVRCPITALVGTEDPRLTVDEGAAWAAHTTGGFELRTMPGGHFYLDSKWNDVAELVRRDLAG